MRVCRQAFSLIEVIVATAILLGSTLVLVQLAGIGREHAWRADDAAEAQMLCQTKMAEILAGIAPLEAADAQSFEDPLEATTSQIREDEEEDRWVYSVEVEPLESGMLTSVTVTVMERTAAEQLGQRTDQQPRSFRLVRWVRNSAVPAGGATPSPAMPFTDQGPPVPFAD